MSLQGHTALVTGSGRALGRGIAVYFAGQGANVITNSRSSPEEAEKTAELCREQGVKSLACVADVSKREDVARIVEESKSFGHVDIVVNNVGVSPFVPFLDITPEEWHTILSINLDSMFYTAQAFIPGMLENKWGRILNVTGHAARHDPPHAANTAAHVAASKAGAMGLTRAIAATYAPFGITCNEVGPARMDTEPRRNKYYKDMKDVTGTHATNFKHEEGHDEVSGVDPSIPVGRIGKPSEFGAACAFLASDDAGFITGQTLMVNGGMVFVN